MSIFKSIKETFAGDGGRALDERFPTPLTPEELWIVALSAITPNKMVGNSYRHLYAGETIRKPATAQYEMQVKRWGNITKPEELQELIAMLSKPIAVNIQDQPHNIPLAWNAASLVDVVRLGFAAELIDEATAWQTLKAFTSQVRTSYDSWQAYAQDVIAGSQLWWEAHGMAPQQAELLKNDSIKASQKLLDPANAKSPWNTVAWGAQ